MKLFNYLNRLTFKAKIYASAELIINKSEEAKLKNENYYEKNREKVLRKYHERQKK